MTPIIVQRVFTPSQDRQLQAVLILIASKMRPKNVILTEPKEGEN